MLDQLHRAGCRRSFLYITHYLDVALCILTAEQFDVLRYSLYVNEEKLDWQVVAGGGGYTIKVTFLC